MLRLKRYPKRSPYWQIKGTVAGVTVFESTGTVDRGQADEYRRKREREIYEQAKLGKIPSATFAEAVQSYITSGGERKMMLALLDHFAERPIDQIGQLEIDAMVAALAKPGSKASTINRNFINPTITVLHHARKAKLPGASQPQIMRRKEERVVVTPASDEHIERLMPYLDAGLAALISFMTFTGRRTGEALRVTEADCKDGFATIYRTKNSEPIIVPLPHGWEYPKGGWGYTTTQGVGKALRAAHKAAGLPYHRAHNLGRHAFSARWLANKALGGISGLQKAGGWNDLRTVSRVYGHLEQTEIHEEMRRLSKKNRAKTEQP